MAEIVFCLTSLLFLAWVIVLKGQVDRLNRLSAQLQAELQRCVRQKTGDVEIGREARVWGRRTVLPKAR